MAANEIEFSEHPEYIANRYEWQKYRDLYDGNHTTLSQECYLWPHELESSKEIYKTTQGYGATLTIGEFLRGIRVKRSRYYNLVEPVISTFISLIFKSEVKVDDKTKQMLGDDIYDIDGTGKTLEDFIKGPVATSYFRDGQPFIYVDANSASFKNKLEQIQANYRPYMELLDILAVKDWQLFEDDEYIGKYELIRWEYCAIDPRTSLIEKPSMSTYTKVLSVKDGKYTIEVFKKVEGGKWEPYGEVIQPDGWDELPLATIWGNESWIKDVSEQQLLLHNQLSWIANVHGSQAYQRVLIAGELNQTHKISVSEYSWGILPPGSTVTVIDPASTDDLRTAADGTVSKLFRVAFNRVRGMSSDSKEAPSDQTLREMNAELIALLVSSIGEMENMMNQALAYYAQFKTGETEFDGKITLPNDITIEDINQELQVFAAYRDEIKQITAWRKAHLKKVASRGGYTDDELNDIEGEIDDLQPFDPMAGLGLGLNGGRAKQIETTKTSGAPNEGQSDKSGSVRLKTPEAPGQQPPKVAS